MPVEYQDNLNLPIAELFAVIEKTELDIGLLYSRNLLFRVYNEFTKNSFSTFEKNFIRLANAYALIVKEKDGSLKTNKSNYDDLKKKFKKEWGSIK